jgi:hypothetical protein
MSFNYGSLKMRPFGVGIAALRGCLKPFTMSA